MARPRWWWFVLTASLGGCGARTLISDGSSGALGSTTPIDTNAGVVPDANTPEVVGPEGDRPLNPGPVGVASQTSVTPNMPPVPGPLTPTPGSAVQAPAPPLAPPPPPVPVPEPVVIPVVEPVPVAVPMPEPVTPPEPAVTPPEPVVPEPMMPPPEPVAEPSPPPVTTAGKCEAPVDLGTATGLVATGSNSGYGDLVTPSCAGTGGSEVVFSWTAAEDGQYTFDTFGSSYDTVLTLYEGQACTPELLCNDDAGRSAQSRLSVAATAGDTFTIAIDGFSYDAVGDYQLTITWAEPVPCDVIDLGSAFGTTSGNFVAQATDFGQIADCGGGTRRLSFLWQAPADGTFSFSSAGSTFDTVLNLRPECGSATSLLCNDDYDGYTSQVEWSLLEGESVVIELSVFGDDPGSGRRPNPGMQSSGYSYELSVAQP